MTDEQDAQSARARERGAAKARKMAKLAWSQNSFDLLASGYSLEQIAEVRRVSARTIRREVDAAVARRRLDAPERYVHLQVARLTKALRFADAALERGDLKAVRALVTVVSAMDRYHALSDALRDRASPGLSGPHDHYAAAALPQPLKLFHAVSPPEQGASEEGIVTGLGA
jgi:hypothetical protein